VRERLAKDKVMDEFMTLGRSITESSTGAGGFEGAVQRRALTVSRTGMFARTMQTEGLGGFNEAVGAAFGLPLGVVSQPIRTADGVFVIRVDQRTPADRAEFDKQKDTQRSQVLRGMREQMVRDYLEGMKKGASIIDNRKKLNAAARRQST